MKKAVKIRDVKISRWQFNASYLFKKVELTD